MWYRNYSCGDCVHCDLNERNRYDNSKAYCSERREYVVLLVKDIFYLMKVGKIQLEEVVT